MYWSFSDVLPQPETRHDFGRESPFRSARAMGSTFWVKVASELSFRTESEKKQKTIKLNVI